MNLNQAYLLLLFFLLFGACSSFKKKRPALDEPHQNDQQSAPEQEPSPAPGSAEVTAEILSLEETSSGYHCSLRIVTVHGYGASTPPLAEGTVIDATATAAALQEAIQEEGTRMKVAAGDSRRLVLRHQQRPNLPGTTPSPWRILFIR